MSEIATEAAGAAEATEPTPAPETAPATLEAPATSEASSEVATEQAPTETPEERQTRGDKRFAVLTAKAAYDRERAQKAERELQEAKDRLAVLEAARGQGEAPDPKQGAVDDVEAKANELLLEREMEQRRQAVVTAGEKALGVEVWKEKTTTLAELGAFNNPNFLPALIEMPNATELVAELADDPQKLRSLLGKRPVAMAAELGRMSAELSAPKRTPLSDAPPPVAPTRPRGTAPEPDLSKMNAQQIVAYWNANPKQAPGRSARR